MRQFARRHATAVIRFARLGYVAKGVVFLTLGAYTARAVLQPGRRPEGVQGALAHWVEQPLGRAVLVGVAFGLLGYVLWLLCRALLDADEQGCGFLGLVRRAACVTSAGAYLALVGGALLVAWRGWGYGEGDTPEEWAAVFLAPPFGPWLVVLAGLALLGVAANHAVVAWNGMFLQLLELPERPRWLAGAMRRFGQWGLLARGVVFAVVGALLLRAGQRNEARFAGGTEDALSVVGQGPLGPWLLGLVAAGFLSLGLFAWLQARFRRVKLP